MLSVFLLLRRRQPKSTLFPYTTLFRSEDQLHERVDTVEKPDRNRRSRKLTRIKWQQRQYDAKTEQVDDYNQKDCRKGGSIHKMALTGLITGSGYYLHAQTRQAIETKVANISSIHENSMNTPLFIFWQIHLLQPSNIL